MPALKKLLPHIIAILILYIVNAAFFAPLFKGKEATQSDMIHGMAAKKQLKDYLIETGETARWDQAMFGGQPAYIQGVYFSDLPAKGTIYELSGFFMKHPAALIFNCMLFMYLMLVVMGVHPIIAALGAFAFGFCGFNIISVEAGHNAKIRAVAFIPLLFAGAHLLWQKKYLLGAAIGTFGMTMIVGTGHYQIVYYAGILLFLYFVIKGVFMIMNKETQSFVLSVGIFVFITLFAIGANLGKIWVVQEYQAYSIRGKQILEKEKKQDPNAIVKMGEAGEGLDRDYAFAWSNGIFESFTFMVPNIYGGGSSEEYDVKDMETYKLLKRQGGARQAKQQVAGIMYWGDQPFTAGPIYAGALISFFFVLGLLVLPRSTVIWAVASFLLFLALSWGKNFESFNYWMFDHFPMYNKFRTVSMTMVICNFIMIFVGILGLNKILGKGFSADNLFFKKVIGAFALTGGLALLFVLFTSSFSFLSSGEMQAMEAIDEIRATSGANFQSALSQAFQQQQINPKYSYMAYEQFYEAIMADREALLRGDALRTFFLILLAAAAIYMYQRKVLNTVALMSIVAFLGLVDNWGVMSRYFGDDNYTKSIKKDYFVASPADKLILADKDPAFRVFNPGNPFNDSKTSYFHRSIGGYHPAKMRRYQDLFENAFYKQGQVNQQVLEMLNAKYILRGQTEKDVIQLPNPCGAAWFVKEVKAVESPNEEMNTLKDFNPHTTAVINTKDFNFTGTSYNSNGAKIDVKEYGPNKIVYAYEASAKQLAVFSEVYYPKGWVVTIDGQPADYIRANYVLRAMEVPSGKHTITWSFEPTSHILGGRIQFILTYVMIVGVLGIIGFEGWKRYKNPTPEEEEEDDEDIV